jgi:hypothetical protein
MFKVEAEIMPLCSVLLEDVKKFISWIWDARLKTCFDMETLTYPRSCMTLAKIDGETSVMIPLQPVLMFESLVRKPGISNRETAISMLKIGEVVERVARDTGHREAYFITNDEPEVVACSKNGWIVYMHDVEKGVYLMKRKFIAVDYTKNQEKEPPSESKIKNESDNK